MATTGGIFIPDYDGSQATALVGTLAVGVASGPIQLGKYRLWKLVLVNATAASSNNIVVRFSTGNSTQGHTAPTPSATSPFLHNFHENIFEFDGSIDQINLITLAVDNSPASVNYCLLPLARN